MKPVSPVLDPCPTLTEIDRSIDTGNFEPGHPTADPAGSRVVASVPVQALSVAQRSIIEGVSRSGLKA
ncbi:MAG: hypothetical protein AVDCRST_MAG52-2632 [uncultured Blastococcus sp.]|uniref:Uncharacterized protein n=1 Tax=uncultured Blastococcus sp. TaxID=217144 RepID=A0A6J4IVF4_9ACTN|nr:MAG: hypothetical protein AVDCRST_MAG52-2632 [uncultured Blastococcus sp.]